MKERLPHLEVTPWCGWIVMLVKPPKILVVITGMEFFILPVLKALEGDFEFTTFNKHLPTQAHMNPLTRKVNALRNILTYRSSQLKNLYKSTDAVVVEWGGLSLKEISRWADGSVPILARIHRWEATSGYVANVNFTKIFRVFVHSQAIKDVTLQCSNAKPEQIKIVGNIVDVDACRYLKKDQWSYKVAIVGGYTPRKRLDLFVKVATQIHPGVTLVFFNTPRQNALQVLRENNYDLKSTIIHPRLPYESYLDHLREADFIINTSESEGAPASLHEAMLCGVIPIIRNWSGASKLYPQHLVLPFEPKAFVEKAVKTINEWYEKPVNQKDSSQLRAFSLQKQNDAIAIWRKTLQEMSSHGRTS